jgi:hypothetical protein
MTSHHASARDALQSLEPRRAARLKQLMAHEGVQRSFLADVPLKSARRNGEPGFVVTVNLTSYRALPLSCLAEIKLSVDAESVDVGRISLVLQGNEYRVADFPKLHDVWWFILDAAVIFVPRAVPLGAGEHDVEGTLVTVEPYMTAGRFAFYSSDKKRLPLQDSVAGGA